MTTKGERFRVVHRDRPFGGRPLRKREVGFIFFRSDYRVSVLSRLGHDSTPYEVGVSGFRGWAEAVCVRFVLSRVARVDRSSTVRRVRFVAPIGWG